MFNFKRFLDKIFFGNIASLFFFINLFKKKLNKKKITSIAFIKLVGMGDGVLQLPALAVFKKQHPHIRITIIATSITADIFGEQSFIDDIIVLKQNPLFLFQLFSLRKSFSVAIDAEPFMNLSFIIAKWISKWSVGFSDTLRKVTHDIKVSFDEKIHMTENYQNLFPFLIEKKKNQ